MKFVLSLLLLIVTVGCNNCATHVAPNTPIETQTAIYASDAMKSVNEVQKLVAAAEVAKLVTTDQAAQVMIVGEKIGKGGVKLSQALSVYHNASDLATKKMLLADVLSTLDEMDADLKMLLAPLDKSGEKLKYLTIVTNAVKSLWSIRLSLPATAGGVA
jgi:hypothetical protein